MSKTVSGATEANIGVNNNLVSCIFVQQRVSGRIQTFVGHDKDLTKDLGDGNGALVYAAASSFLQTAISSTGTFSVDNLEIEGIIDSTAFSLDDIDAGKYDRATIKMFLLDWTDVSLDPIKLRRGTVGDITTAEKSFQAQLRGMLQRYTEEIVELYSPSCRVDLGSVRCGERMDPPAWTASTAYTVREPRDTITGSVVKPSSFNDRHFKCTIAGTSGTSEPSWNTTVGGTTVDGGVTWTTIRARTIEITVDAITDNRVFTIIYTGDAPDAFLLGGLAKVLDGENTGVNVEVKNWVLSANTLTLFLPLPLEIGTEATSFLGLEDGSGNLLLEGGDDLLLETGTRIDIQAGCAKDLVACRDTFDNIYNAQAEWYVPGIKVLIRTPNAQ